MAGTSQDKPGHDSEEVARRGRDPLVRASVRWICLKEELTRRVNAAIAPNKVRAVLFKEIVVQ
jgi:flagellar protein FliL